MPDVPDRVSPIRSPGTLPALAILAGVGLVCGVLRIFPPGDEGPALCATKALTGLDCPFCGGLRAVSALLHGHPVIAADQNLVVLVLAPLAVFWWLRLYRRRPGPERRPGVGLAVVLVLAIFTLVRNLPVGAWLASGTG